MLLAGAVYAPPASATDTVDHVVVVGTGGLRWSDINAKDTPNIWRLADRGSIGSLSVRAAGSITCPDDGWVTLGAGNRARGAERHDGACRSNASIGLPKVAPNGSADLADYAKVQSSNDQLSYGSDAGSLASSTGCVGAIGRSAALSAAHPGGYLDYYVPSLPADPKPALLRCPVSVVSGANVTGAHRRVQMSAFDTLVGKVVASLPAHTVVIVTGIADMKAPPHLAPIVIDGPGFGRSFLISPSTQRRGYTQLIDIAPTVFDLLNVGAPGSVVGQPIHASGNRSGGLASAAHDLVDADKAAQAQRPWVQLFFTVLVLANIALLAVSGYFFHRRRMAVIEAQEQAHSRPTEDTDTEGVVEESKLPVPPVQRRWERIVERAALTLGCLPIASFIAQLVPWWRAPAPVLIHLLCIAAVIALMALAAYYGPWAAWVLGPVAFVAVVTAVVMAADILTGSTMQLNSLAGYSPLVAGRFMGLGNLSFAIFAAAVLLSAAYIAQLLNGWRRISLLIGVGLAAVIIVGTPSLGDDVGGVIALTPAVLALVLRGAGVRLSTVRVVACGVAGIVVVSLFAIFDYSRPEEDRTHLGRFVQQIMDGTAGIVIRRKAEANVHLLFTSKLTLLVLAVAAFVILVAWRRGAGLRRLLGIYPCLRAGLLAVLFAAVFGFLANDSGIAVPAFMAVVTMPLLIATVLRVLRT
jgi:hypothetical protein